MASQRRLGPRNSDTSNAILDATEEVMRLEGYAAVTSRRIAEAAGIRQGLVYYYFQTMDDLLLATFKRRTADSIEKLDAKLQLERPVHAVWDDLAHRVDAALAFEFVALANHHSGIREEVNRYVSHARQLTRDAIAREAEHHGVDLAPFTPEALAFLMYSSTLMVACESAGGLDVAHAEVLTLFEKVLEKLA